MEKTIFLKISEIKDIIAKKIKTFDDYNKNKNIIIDSIEEIEKMLKEIFHMNIEENNYSSNNGSKEININNKQMEDKEKQKIIQDENINKNKENEIFKEDFEKKGLNKRNIKIEIKDEDLINDKTKFENMNILEKKEEISNNKVNDDINNINIMNSNNTEQNDEKQNLEMQEEEDINNNNENNKDNEKYSLPKLNFDYDKNLNELLNDININQEKLFLKTPLDDDKSNILNNNIKDESSKNKNSSINSDIIKNIFQKK